MMNAVAFKDQIKELEAALHSGGLPDAMAELARECIARSQRSLRVAIVGSELRTTTDLANFFMGQQVLPVSVGLDVPVRLGFAETAKLGVKADNGSKDVHGLDAIEAVLAEDPQSAWITAPLSPLKQFTLMRVGMDEDMSEEGVSEILAASDVVFWCSDAAETREKEFWAEFPARLADHGYLVLSKGAECEAADQHLFHKVIRADLPRAEDLRAAPHLDRDAFEASGGLALLAAMRREISAAERAIADAAAVILMRNPGQANVRADQGTELRTRAEGSGEADPTTQRGLSECDGPWNDSEFPVSRIRRAVAPRRVKPAAAATARPTSSIRDEADTAQAPDGNDKDPQSDANFDFAALAGFRPSPAEEPDMTAEDAGDSEYEARPVGVADLGSFARKPDLSPSASETGAPNEQADAAFPPPRETDSASTSPAERLREMLARREAQTDEGGTARTEPDLGSEESAVDRVVSTLLADIEDILADNDKPSEWVLDWVEDKLTFLREFVETAPGPQAADAEALTESIDDALEAVSILRFEEDDEADAAREDALQMAIQVGRELQTRFAV